MSARARGQGQLPGGRLGMRPRSDESGRTRGQRHPGQNQRVAAIARLRCAFGSATNDQSLGSSMSGSHSEPGATMSADAKAHEEDARRLREFPAFAKFSDDDLKRLVTPAHHFTTSAPRPLIHEQTPSDACYILLSGEAGVYVGSDRVAVVWPGEVIGESALRQGKIRKTT